MSAVIESGGTKHRVKVGEVVRLQKIETGVGSEVNFKVLAMGDGANINIGTPYLEDAKVVAEVINHERGDKITTIKFKRRKHHMKKLGHRQWYTFVRITSIGAA